MESVGRKVNPHGLTAGILGGCFDDSESYQPSIVQLSICVDWLQSQLRKLDDARVQVAEMSVDLDPQHGFEKAKRSTSSKSAKWEDKA